jgi:hypothetical protein
MRSWALLLDARRFNSHFYYYFGIEPVASPKCGLAFGITRELNGAKERIKIEPISTLLKWVLKKKILEISEALPDFIRLYFWTFKWIRRVRKRPLSSSTICGKIGI